MGTTLVSPVLQKGIDFKVTGMALRWTVWSIKLDLFLHIRNKGIAYDFQIQSILEIPWFQLLLVFNIKLAKISSMQLHHYQLPAPLCHMLGSLSCEGWSSWRYWREEPLMLNSAYSLISTQRSRRQDHILPASSPASSVGQNLSLLLCKCAWMQSPEI